MGEGIVHSHGYKADVMTLIASAGLKIPIVTSIHGWTTENFKVKLYETLQLLSWRFYDRIFCVSRSYLDVAYAKGFTDSTLRLLYNGIIIHGKTLEPQQADLRRRITSCDEVIVTIIGRLSPEKGHRFFLEIAARVLAAERKAKFLIVGEGAERASVEKLLDQLGLRDKVILLGHIDEMQSVYDATDIVAICSLREGLPNVMLESMLNGKPVVSFTVGGVPEVAGNEQASLLVEPGDVDGFTRRICMLIDSKETRVAMGNLGRERVVAHFSFESRISKIEGHYNELLNGHPLLQQS